MMFLLISVPVRGFDIFARLIHLKIVVLGCLALDFSSVHLSPISD